ncbi:response regulator [Spirulina sp. CCNP1310]|uniref:response regulator n=1 Tax=Spirulina sp. CCNP1310 TaxID=3110249 RepID=UPI002B1F127F|nr:response regulator [Spirulina sp. CCNP1310]MEA5420906.1 response regulator [Spirulina sp. CCNP1310]
MTQPYSLNSDLTAAAVTPVTLIQGLAAQLQPYCVEKFTGQLTVSLNGGLAWDFYLHLGRLVWVGRGEHPVRQWRRSLLIHCQGLDPKELQDCADLNSPNPEYHALVMLTLRQKINHGQAIAIVTEVAQNSCFDLIRAIALASLHAESEPYTLTVNPTVRPSSTGMLPQAAMLDLIATLHHSQGEWQNWVAAGLSHCSPNLAPIIVDAALLESHSPNHYQQLSRLINGQRSLRDIAALKGQTVMAITRAFIPFIENHLLTLAVLPHDLPRQPQKPTPPTAQADPARKPLIACIDDDQRVQACLHKLLTNAGYRVLSITNPIEALPLLLKYKPDAVLLDLVMPIANGYEICAQIRRVSEFKNLPVLMLTSNDGVVDRMRAKMVGASGFLTKTTSGAKLKAALQAQCTPTA